MKCVKCGEEKPAVAFEHQRNRPNPRKTCKPCRYLERDREKEKKRHSAYMKERRQTDPDALRINWERSRYGVAKEDLNDKACAICGGDKRLSIDHDHSSGRVRGLLCSPCNAGLGMFKDDPERLAKAIGYLKERR